MPSSDIIVKLADGQTVTTRAYTTCVVQLGPLFVNLRFEILEADVSTILGMPFLETCNPKIDWRKRTMQIKYKTRLIDIPTLSKRV